MDQNKIAVDVFNKLAKTYQDKFMNVDLYKDSFDFFCQNIKNENAEILDLACGPGKRHTRGGAPEEGVGVARRERCRCCAQSGARGRFAQRLHSQHAGARQELGRCCCTFSGGWRRRQHQGELSPIRWRARRPRARRLARPAPRSRRPGRER